MKYEMEKEGWLIEGKKMKLKNGEKEMYKRRDVNDNVDRIKIVVE
jgi:hypothetical protein